MPTEIKQANMLKEIISNRKLIWDLSKNAFKYRQTQRVTVGRFQYYIFHLYPLLRSYF